jgi:hypothetical protein
MGPGDALAYLPQLRAHLIEGEPLTGCNPLPAPVATGVPSGHAVGSLAGSADPPGGAPTATEPAAGYHWCHAAGMNHLQKDGGQWTVCGMRRGIVPGHDVLPDCPECQHIAAARSAPKATPTARKHDPVFDAIALGSFGLEHVAGKVGSRIGGIAAAVKDCTPEEHRATLGDDLPKMYLYLKAKYPDLSAPREALKICASLAEWRQVNVRRDVTAGGWKYIEREVEPGRTEMVWVQS